ncbi:hypothetical protein ROS217_14571 [Roseovarius sp. 217]|nr:hypothetical protein ROS217_14571 [Roseovarius sp. 217]
MTRMSNSGISLIPENPDKVSWVVDRVRDAFVEHLIGDCGADPLTAEETATEICNRELTISRSETKTNFLSIAREGEPVGVIWKTERMISDRKTWHLLYIETFAPHRNKGIAEAAMIELIRLAKQDGVTEITLNVSPRNTSASSLYEKLGFGRQSGGYGLRL